MQICVDESPSEQAKPVDRMVYTTACLMADLLGHIKRQHCLAGHPYNSLLSTSLRSADHLAAVAAGTVGPFVLHPVITLQQHVRYCLASQLDAATKLMQQLLSNVLTVMQWLGGSARG